MNTYTDTGTDMQPELDIDLNMGMGMGMIMDRSPPTYGSDGHFFMGWRTSVLSD
jgi:hypothetical protein